MRRNQADARTSHTSAKATSTGLTRDSWVGLIVLFLLFALVIACVLVPGFAKGLRDLAEGFIFLVLFFGFFGLLARISDNRNANSNANANENRNTISVNPTISNVTHVHVHPNDKGGQY